MGSYLWVKQALVGHRVVLRSTKELEGRTTFGVSRHMEQKKVLGWQNLHPFIDLSKVFSLSSFIMIFYIQFIYALIFIAYMPLITESLIFCLCIFSSLIN